MNSSIFLCCVLVVSYVSAAELPPATLLDEFVVIGNTCSAAHNIKPEELTDIHNYEYLKKLEASDDIKCFTKCLSDKSGAFDDNGLNTERFMEIANAHKQDSSKTLKAIAKCKDLYKGKKDCQEHWDMYLCFHSEA